MKPKIYKSAQHQIDRELIDPDALFVLETLQKAGHTAYLVGGSVRDLLLGYTPKDFDISTSAEPEEIKPLFRYCILIGRRFRLAHVRFGRKIIEVSTFRMGDNEDDSLIIRDNEFGDPQQDVLRRDFTINGLFYNNEDDSIIDYVGGYEDAKKRILRSIGNPEVRFKQDPVRMIRLLKFRARFGLEAEKDAIQAMLDCRAEILKSSQARLMEEFFRMMESGASLPFIKLLAEYGFLEILLPTFSKALSHEIGSEVLSMLGMNDQLILEKSKFRFNRAILMASFSYPLFHRHLHVINDGRHQSLHLGNIQDEAMFILKDAFSPNLSLPKRIFAHVVSILTTQFRFTPIEKKKRINHRIPRNPYFDDAMRFFKLRSYSDPGLTKIYAEWDYYWQKSLKSRKNSETNPRNKRQRPRRRR